MSKTKLHILIRKYHCTLHYGFGISESSYTRVNNTKDLSNLTSNSCIKPLFFVQLIMHLICLKYCNLRRNSLPYENAPSLLHLYNNNSPTNNFTLHEQRENWFKHFLLAK